MDYNSNKFSVISEFKKKNKDKIYKITKEIV